MAVPWLRSALLASLVAGLVVANGVVGSGPNNSWGSGGPSSSGSTTTSPPGAAQGNATNTTMESPPLKAEPRLVFDHVEAEYASTFQVRMDNASQGGWARGLAGDNGTLDITYGVLRFWSTDQPAAVGGEAFLKVEGPNGSRRFLGNSGSWTYWNETDPGAVRSAMLEFSSHKQVVNGTVVKDFTPPVFTVHLWRALDENGTLQEMMIAAWDDWDEGFNEFWKGRPVRNTWTLVPGSLREAGDAAVRVQP